MRRQTFLTAVIVVIAWAGLAFGYILERTGGGNALFWDLSRNDAKVSAGKVIYTLNGDCSADMAVNVCLDTLRKSFNNWSVQAQGPGATSTIEFQEAPTTTSRAATGNDDINLLVFVNNDPDLTGGVIALTTSWFNSTTGEMWDSDIKFNDSGFNFSGAPGSEDLEAVATHEIGHLLGLDHSFVGFVGVNETPSIAATMYPFSLGSSLASLEQDDIAGVSVIYPSTALTMDYGSVAGTALSGNTPPLPVFGAHIALLDEVSGVPIVAAVTDPSGNYLIQGVPAGVYVVMAEPPLNIGYLGSYYGSAQTIYMPQLYDGHVFQDFNQAAPGMEPFDSVANRITVTAGVKESFIDFLIADLIISPPPVISSSGGGGGGGGGGGCAVQPDKSVDLGWFLLFIAPLIGVAGIRLRHGTGRAVEISQQR